MKGEAIICDDVVAMILAKLPVKSLLRFNGVCKTWLSLISDPQFSNSSHRMQHSVLISDKNFSTITIQSLLAKDSPPTPLPLPWETERGSINNMCLGSSNGLVCVHHTSGMSYDMSGLILWNPSTRKFRRIPFPEGLTECSYGCACVYVWFGYDESASDYKLVLLTCSGFILGTRIKIELLVFTVRSNIWRSQSVTDRLALGLIKIFLRTNYFGNCKSIGALSNGAVHWINRDFPYNGDRYECVLALDLVTEKFRLMRFRHSSWLGQDAWMGSLSGGHLCLCSTGRGCVRNLWMMKEYGVESSWTKVVSIPIPTFYPIFLSEEGKELVALRDYDCSVPRKRAKIVKLRVEEGTEDETLLVVHRDYVQYNNVFLHMEESLVSLC